MTIHVPAFSISTAPVSTAPVIGSLADRAILVNQKISQWSARKKDAKASHDITTANNAALDRASVHKRLVAKAALARIQACVSSARKEHDALTLPWGVKGLAILAQAGFAHYLEVMGKYQREFDSAVAEFDMAYPALREAAAKGKDEGGLGDLFNIADYPNPEDIRGRFRFTWRFMPVPTSGDLRVDLPQADLDAIKDSIESHATNRANAAVKMIYERVVAMLETTIATLDAYVPGADGQRAKGAFHGTLMGNLRDLAERLPFLNVFGDPAIEALAERIRKMADIDTKDLKESDALRADTVSQAKATIDEIKATAADYL